MPVNLKLWTCKKISFFNNETNNVIHIQWYFDKLIVGCISSVIIIMIAHFSYDAHPFLWLLVNNKRCDTIYSTLLWEIIIQLVYMRCCVTTTIIIIVVSSSPVMVSLFGVKSQYFTTWWEVVWYRGKPSSLSCSTHIHTHCSTSIGSNTFK